MSTNIEPFVKRLAATLGSLRDSRIVQPFFWFSDKCLYQPVHRIIFYNSATEKFADEHPTLTAFGILLVVYALVLLLAHLLHKLFLKIHGPSRWHLAAQDIRQSRSRQAAAPKRRATSKKEANKDHPHKLSSGEKSLSSEKSSSATQKSTAKASAKSTARGTSRRKTKKDQ